MFQRDRFPAGAGNDFQIQLHGDAVRLHAKLGNQRGDGQSVSKVALLAIDLQLHS